MVETVLEHKVPAKPKAAPKAAPRKEQSAEAEKVAGKLALLDEMEQFFSALTKDTPPLRDDAVARSYIAQIEGEEMRLA